MHFDTKNILKSNRNHTLKQAYYSLIIHLYSWSFLFFLILNIIQLQ